jgi:hypothetical protein
MLLSGTTVGKFHLAGIFTIIWHMENLQKKKMYFIL